jgi:hypothetical protein
MVEGVGRAQCPGESLGTTSPERRTSESTCAGEGGGGSRATELGESSVDPNATGVLLMFAGHISSVRLTLWLALWARKVSVLIRQQCRRRDCRIGLCTSNPGEAALSVRFVTVKASRLTPNANSFDDLRPGSSVLEQARKLRSLAKRERIICHYY